MPMITCDGGQLEYREGSGGSYEIFEIGVDSSVRRTGIGRRMVNMLIEVCHAEGVERIYAITRAENRIAQEWYEALKFHPIPLYDFYGMLTEEKRHTVDAIMYVRDLRLHP